MVIPCDARRAGGGRQRIFILMNSFLFAFGGGIVGHGIVCRIDGRWAVSHLFPIVWAGLLDKTDYDNLFVVMKVVVVDFGKGRLEQPLSCLARMLE